MPWEMIPMFRSRLLILLSLLLSCAPVWAGAVGDAGDRILPTAQDSLKVRYECVEDPTVTEFDENSLQRHREDPDFNYVEVAPPDNIFTRFSRWLGDLWNSFLRWLTGGQELNGFWQGFFQALPYICIGGLLILFVYLLTKADERLLMRGKNIDAQVLASDEEAVLNRDDIPKLIVQALEDKNYRLAIRFYYLLLLQKLSSKEIIDWQAQKTNREYIHEISDENIRNRFRDVTRIYDFIWYGQFTVDSKDFAKAETKFKNLQQAL